MYKIGVVSFLNSRPLVEGLDREPEIEMLFDVPARLGEQLDRGEVDAALVPIVDLLRAPRRYRVLSDACIGCDGETMTVRIFSQVPPDRITRVRADTDSHTSVALARVMFAELYRRELQIEPLDARRESLQGAEAVLLIGDKVVDTGRAGFAYEVDLGGAWRAHTGLPFVFAVWAHRAGAEGDAFTDLAARLSRARDEGVARAEIIARRDGPGLGWPVELAVRYLTRCLTFRLDPSHIAGATRFAELFRAHIVPDAGEIRWPEKLVGVALGDQWSTV